MLIFYECLKAKRNNKYDKIMFKIYLKFLKIKKNCGSDLLS
jgi:hypothetical protein